MVSKVRHRDCAFVVLHAPMYMLVPGRKGYKKDHLRDAWGSHTLSESDMSKREGLGFRLESIVKAEMVKGGRRNSLRVDKGRAGPGRISGASGYRRLLGRFHYKYLTLSRRSRS